MIITFYVPMWTTYQSKVCRELKASSGDASITQLANSYEGEATAVDLVANCC